MLFGSTTPMTPEQLARYSSPAEYEDAFEAATDAVIDDGFVLEDDRQEMLDDADPSVIAG